MRPSARVLCLLLFANACFAAPIVTFQGTGLDSAISFRLLLSTFSFGYCNAPTNETCEPVKYSAGGGVMRFTAVGTGIDTRTFALDSFLNNGVYETLSGGASPNSGTVTDTGSTSSLPEPVSFVLTCLGLVTLVGRRWMYLRGR
jgi:hypothetical protein